MLSDTDESGKPLEAYEKEHEALLARLEAPALSKFKQEVVDLFKTFAESYEITVNAERRIQELTDEHIGLLELLGTKNRAVEDVVSQSKATRQRVEETASKAEKTRLAQPGIRSEVTCCRCEALRKRMSHMAVASTMTTKGSVDVRALRARWRERKMIGKGAHGTDGISVCPLSAWDRRPRLNSASHPRNRCPSLGTLHQIAALQTKNESLEGEISAGSGWTPDQEERRKELQEETIEAMHNLESKNALLTALRHEMTLLANLVDDQTRKGSLDERMSEDVAD